MVSGEADVWVEQDGSRTHIATLKSGSGFGEMGMMTGEPRRATVSARTDIESLRLGKSGVESVLRERSDIAKEISEVIAARQGELDQARKDLATGSDGAPAPEAIGARIRSFFGLGS